MARAGRRLWRPARIWHGHGMARAIGTGGLGSRQGHGRQAGRHGWHGHSGRQAGRQAGRVKGRGMAIAAGRQAGRQGPWSGRPRQAGRHDAMATMGKARARAGQGQGQARQAQEAV